MLKFTPNIKNFSLLGVNKATKDQDRVKTEIVNNLCLIAMIGWVFNNLVINFLDGKYFDILVAVPLFISFFLPLYLNKVNKTHLSRLVLILSVSISLGSMYMAVGPRNYYEFLFILLFILILYLIDERRAQVILAFFVFLTWAIPYVYTKNYEPILGYSQKSGVVEVVFLCSMIAIYLISKK